MHPLCTPQRRVAPPAGRMRADVARGSEAPRPHGTEADFPAAGVSFEQAADYVKWLSEVTGATWRLPSAAEAKRWGKGKGGNTLDAWLGYRATPSDLESVRSRLQATSVELLKPVGSHGGSRAPGHPDGPMVFDLDGNVAEWATGADGSGVASGPSADRPGDSKEKPGRAMTGLRVVRDGE
ncbi:MAG: SUMF1/EgtB/PvdO family nonheme iron enzyme [Acidobacteriota bacterium]